MTRAVPEWIGASDDAKVPPRVRLRIFTAHDGRCHITRRKIMPHEPWDLDHIRALCNGGQHRESNMAPALRDRHRRKTADDVREKAKVARVRAKHLGVRTKRPWPFTETHVRGVDNQVRRRDA